MILKTFVINCLTLVIAHKEVQLKGNYQNYDRQTSENIAEVFGKPDIETHSNQWGQQPVIQYNDGPRLYTNMDSHNGGEDRKYNGANRRDYPGLPIELSNVKHHEANDRRIDLDFLHTNLGNMHKSKDGYITEYSTVTSIPNYILNEKERKETYENNRKETVIEPNGIHMTGYDSNDQYNNEHNNNNNDNINKKEHKRVCISSNVPKSDIFSTTEQVDIKSTPDPVIRNNSLSQQTAKGTDTADLDDRIAFDGGCPSGSDRVYSRCVPRD